MPIRIGHWLQGIWIGISKMFHKLEKETKVLLPAVVKVVNEIKKIVDGPAADIITAIIPGDIDDKIKDKLREILPVAILKLNIIASINGIEDTNEKLKAILSAINLSPDETKNIYYHGLGALILEELSDGKFSWSDATVALEYYYAHIYKAEQPETPEP
jgi:hypothetical protein